MECGKCTLCCTLLDIPWMDSKAGETCKYCNKGCTIHETKDTRCKEFSCAYTQMAKVNIALRPDKCGVIFERIQDDIMIGTLDSSRENFNYLQGQINSLLKEKINVVLIKNGIPIVYHVDDADPTEVLSRAYKAAEKTHGGSGL